MDIESTALLTFPTAPLTRPVKELEVTEVARDKNEPKPLADWRAAPVVPERVSPGEPPEDRGSAWSTLYELVGANVTLFERLLQPCGELDEGAT